MALTLGAGALAPFLNLPEALLRETGLFLIAYTALVGWLATRSSVMKALVLFVIVGNAAWTLGSIALLFSGAVRPNLLGQLFPSPRRLRPACLRSCSISGCARARRW